MYTLLMTLVENMGVHFTYDTCEGCATIIIWLIYAPFLMNRHND